MLRDLFRTLGHGTAKMTRIRFGDVEIIAPLDHPAVHWRYQPVGFNRNYSFVVKRILRRRMGLIIDVGANIGDGVALLRGEGIDAPILAVEGAGVWFELLKTNTKDIAGVMLEHVFLGAHEERDNLSVNVKDGTSKLTKGTDHVQLSTLDSLVEQHTQFPVVLVKTDTDGFDAQVLFGARSILTEQSPVVFCEVDEGLLRDQGNSSQELMEYLSQCGYTQIAVWDNFGRWITSRPISSGIADLVVRYPGGTEAKPYLDIAALSETDRDILD